MQEKWNHFAKKGQPAFRENQNLWQGSKELFGRY